MTRLRKIVLTTVLSFVGVVVLLVAFLAQQMFWGRPVADAAPDTIRVACVGDSITYGALFKSADRYPNELENLLGPGYSVRNFGASGFTAQKAGDHPYWNHRYFKLGSDYAPNLVTIMLGTNDSKTQNWTGAARFDTDLRALVAHYQGLPSKPRVVLMTPPSAFIVRDRKELPAGMSAQAITEIAEDVKKTGAELGLQVIDIHAATATHPEFFKFDGIHPDGDGARFIAKTIYDALQLK